MEVRRQTCQACGSRELRNFVVRGEELGQAVFVQCVRCEAMVARYVLSQYYHHGKGFESFLRASRWSSAESGRLTLDEFNRVQEEAEEQFVEVLAAVAAKGG
jgi:RNase P subunit RPR2